MSRNDEKRHLEARAQAGGAKLETLARQFVVPKEAVSSVPVIERQFAAKRDAEVAKNKIEAVSPELESRPPSTVRRIGNWFRGALPLPSAWHNNLDTIKSWVGWFSKFHIMLRLLMALPVVVLAILIIPVPGPWSAVLNSVAAAMVLGMWGAEWAMRISQTFIIQPSVWVLKNGFNLLWNVLDKFAYDSKRPKMSQRGTIPYYPLVNVKD
ncbi:MAG: hypothetical protein RLZZ283_109 [Candidatus Parcubacteria bacterium]|jgi:hypothetical protein